MGNERMAKTSADVLDRIINYLQSETVLERVREQQKARQLLFAGQTGLPTATTSWKENIESLQERLSPASEVFVPEQVQERVYSADTGTNIIPKIFKNLFINNRLSFVARPGSLEDLTRFVQWTSEQNQKFTVRGTGTWPFGGAVPLNGDAVLDLSYLNFMRLFPEEELLPIGPGVTFKQAREYLKKQRFALRQEITNPGSGTIAGWIATGGLGLGSFKYGHVKESVALLLVLTPQGELLKITPDDERFELIFGSEGQIGIIAGVALRVRKESFVNKPFAFSLSTTDDVFEFLNRVNGSGINPTSVIYFDQSYIKETYAIEKEHIEKRSANALRNNDQVRLAEAREDFETIEELKEAKHVIVLQFDTSEDYQQAIKTRLFGKSGGLHRVGGLKIHQLSTALSHRLWDHRYLPVQMKQKGPAMLVSENILPLNAFTKYQIMLRNFLDRLLNIE